MEGMIMDIVVFALIMTMVIRVVVAMWRTLPQNSLPSSNSETTTSAHPYHCVAIRHRGGACAAVQRLSGQRFLSKEAPPVPLPACDAATCHCRYVHFEDRRQNDERRSPHPVLLHVGGYHGPERRSSEERRRFATEARGGDKRAKYPYGGESLLT
jgi:hypothetical protein